MMHGSLPVNNSVRVKIFQSQEDLRSIKLGLAKGELFSLYVQHKVSTAYILHHKIHPRFCLEARMKTEKERMALASCHKEDTLFRACTIIQMSVKCGASLMVRDSPLDFIIVDNELFLEHLDGKQPIRFLLLGEHDFAEKSFAQDCQEVEIVQANLTLVSGLPRRLTWLQRRLHQTCLWGTWWPLLHWRDSRSGKLLGWKYRL
jgi:hypothetical protein